MTTSRVIRGTKAKIFLYICGILVITGLIACYNSTLTQLDDVKKVNDVCHQQQENLSTQLQVISEYKQKLEKSLKNEKADHQQSLNNLESKINEERSKSEKQSSDALLKYKSLQQHFNLLQTEHDDFKAVSSKIQKQQLEEINSLQSKLKEVEEELKKVKVAKESIKTQFTEVELENIRLNKALQKTNENESQQTLHFYMDEYHALRTKYNSLKVKCGEPLDDNSAALPEPANKASEKSALNFPRLKLAENPSSSTKAVLKLSSLGLPNGARPPFGPSVTPETAKREANLKPPQGVVQPPENRENQNEQPQVQVRNKVEKVDDPENDNVAQEVFDAPVNNGEGLGFVDDSFKPAPNAEQKRIAADNKKRDEDYKDLQREEEGDDDLDEYGNHQERAEDVIVRN